MMPRTRVKFCGIMRPEDAVAAAAAGADAIGMILHSGTRREIDLAMAKNIVAALPPYVAAVGVFVNASPETIVDFVNSALLQAAQLHGDESPEFVARCGTVPVIKVLKADANLAAALDIWRRAFTSGEVPNLSGVLIDSPGGGGTGEANDFARLRRLVNDNAFAGLPPLIVAGGLKPENVGDVVATLRPFAVDTSSGIEAEFGSKSPDKMRAFYNAVAKADRG